MEELDVKLLQLHAISPKKKVVEDNDLRTSHLTTDKTAENMRVLERCRSYWEDLQDFRDRRKRARKYLRGDQWHELVEDDDGNVITEEEHIRARGKIPFKQNIISNIVRNIVGQYRAAATRPIVIARKRDDAMLSEMLTNALHTVQDVNEIKELDASMLREKMISGATVCKTTYAYMKTMDKEDGYYQNINPAFLFFNTDMSDVRGFDIRLIGEIKDLPLDDIISAFAKTEGDEKTIKSWYSSVQQEYINNNKGLTAEKFDSPNFYYPSGSNLARLYEVWELVSDWRTYEHDYLYGTYKVTKRSLQQVSQENAKRIAMGVGAGMTVEEIPLIDARRTKEQIWVVKYLTPLGQCLWQGETPYEHQEHPYTAVFHPMIDNEVYGLVEEIIDQQRYINRLISLIDFIMGTAAKGVLLVPEDSIPEGMSIDDFADEWTRYNGVIKFKAKPGMPLPQQVSSNATNIGAYELLSMQLKLAQEISGVSNAIQGHSAKSGTPSSLYAQEAINSATNIKDMMDNFNFYRLKRDKKMLKVILQFYEKGRLLKISGQKYNEVASVFDPELIKNVEYDLVITSGMDVPAYRQMLDDELFKLIQLKEIDIKQYLENVSLPFADNILQSIKTKEQQIQAMQAVQGQIQQNNPQGGKMIDRLFSQPS